MIKYFQFTQEAPKEAEKIMDERARYELIRRLRDEIKFNQGYELSLEKTVERGTWEKKYTYKLGLKEKEYEEPTPYIRWPK